MFAAGLAAVVICRSEITPTSCLRVDSQSNQPIAGVVLSPDSSSYRSVMCNFYQHVAGVVFMPGFPGNAIVFQRLGQAKPVVTNLPAAATA